jgi:hypothetical protein
MGGFVEHGKSDWLVSKTLMRWARREAAKHKAILVSYYYEPREGEKMGVIGWTGQVEWPPIR